MANLKQYKQAIITIAIVIFGSCLGNLSQTALNAMFSGIAVDFGVDVGLGQWVTTLYMLVLGITVPAVTYLMKRFRLKQLVLASLCLLLLGALVDLLAWDFASLIAGRILQAISAGITMPMMMSIAMITFPKDRQATVMGVAGIAMGFAPNIGPTIGGAMIELAGWRSFFAALCVLAVVLIVLALFLIGATTKQTTKAKLDAVSLLLSAVGFGFLLLGFSNASSFDLASPFIWAPLVIGVVGLVLFVKRQKKVDQPLINLDIFRSQKFVVSFWAGNFLFASFMGITLILPLFVEGVWGGSAFQAGLALLPGTVAAFIFNPLAGILTDKIGVRPVVFVAACCLVCGSVAMIFISDDTPFWMIVLFQGIRASGVSGLISPLTSWGMSDLSHAITTDASSFSTAARQACASMGTALMVFAVTLGSASFGSAVVGYQIAFAVSAFFAVLLFISVVSKVR